MDAFENDITKLVAEITEIEEEEIWEKRNNHFFEELNLDSLLALEIIARIEKKYKIEIDEDRLAQITTLSKTIEVVKELL